MREYRRATAVTPSVPELEEAYQWPNASEAGAVRRLGRRLLEEARAGAVLVTRGRQGMLLLERGGRAVAIPAFGADQVVDVTGAGDTVAAARRALKNSDAVLIADYGYGAASPAVVRALLRGGSRAPVVVDSRYQVRAYRRVTAVTPSVPELEEAYLWPNASDANVVRRLGRRLLKEVRAGAVLVTRGRQGMLLLQRGGRSVAIPPFGTDQVVDVTGAGDTVAASFAAALAAGADFEAAARLANIAGGLVVRKRGTATVSAAEIRAALSA